MVQLGGPGLPMISCLWDTGQRIKRLWEVWTHPRRPSVDSNCCHQRAEEEVPEWEMGGGLLVLLCFVPGALLMLLVLLRGGRRVSALPSFFGVKLPCSGRVGHHKKHYISIKIGRPVWNFQLQNLSTECPGPVSWPQAVAMETQEFGGLSVWKLFRIWSLLCACRPLRSFLWTKGWFKPISKWHIYKYFN